MLFPENSKNKEDIELSLSIWQVECTHLESVPFFKKNKENDDKLST